MGRDEASADNDERSADVDAPSTDGVTLAREVRNAPIGGPLGPSNDEPHVTIAVGSIELRPVPVVGGALVELGVGSVGFVLPSNQPLAFWTALLGAVIGPAVAASLSNRGFSSDVLSGVAADLLSSVAFFVLVLVGYLAVVAAEEGLHVLTAAVVSFYYVLLGGIVAIPIAIVSVLVATVAAAATSLLQSRLRPLVQRDRTRPE